MKHLALACLAACLGAALATPARADVSAAARAFSDGQAAQLEGNYERAAQSFELAFNIAPSKEALRSAVRARDLAGQLPRAATLAQVLLATYGDDATSVKLANDVIAEARTKLGRVAVTCAPRCTLVVGGRAISLHAAPSHVVFTAPGHHTLEITFDGDRTATREVTLRAGDDLALPVEPPPVKRAAKVQPPAPPLPARRDGPELSPYWVIGGAAATLVLAGATTWSGLDTDKAHDTYVAAPTAQGWNDGRSKQQRTNVLLGATAAAAITTTLIAVVWTRWDDSPAREVAVVPHDGGVTFSFGCSF
jgi:hypothetical protein